MLVVFRRLRRTGLTALGVCAAFVLASCGEEVIAPPVENYSPGVPILSFSSEFDQYQFLGFVKDDQGANDTPSQSDLNAFTRADNVSGKIGVKWVWDAVDDWTGTGQTGDACALFDTTPSTANKGKGMANFAVCVRISNPGGDPTVVAQLGGGASPLLYSCGDTKAERCASSVRSLPTTGIVCEVEKVAGEGFFTAGEDGGDVIAACSIPTSVFGSTVAPNLLNVCSFPSGSPNSNPFDCVVTPGAGFFTIKKATTPQNSGETFSFRISPAPTPTDTAAKSLTDNTTGVEQTALISALPGTKIYRISEDSIPTNWSLDNIVCAFDRAGAPAMGTRSGIRVDSLTIESGETTICTFTNSRNQGTIELKKVWSGTAGQTTLNIGTDSAGTQVASTTTGAAGAAPLTTGAQSVNTGTYYVSESGGLTNYSASLACTNKGNSITVGSNGSVSVSTGDVVVCTFTNTRNQASIEVKKVWSGTAGQTRLKIGSTVGGGEVDSTLTGAAGASPLSTGTKNVNTGTYYVSESGGLGNYTASLACTNKGTPFTPDTDNAITVVTGDVVICTFTNTRNQGSIELTKVWSGTPGQTTLRIGTSSGGSQVASVLTGAAGAAPLTTTAQTVNTGTYFLSESGGLNNYTRQLECTSNGSPISSAGDSVAVAKNAVVVCTFTNTRAQGSIELKKVWSGPGGQTTLKIGTTEGGSEVKSQQTGAAGAAPLSTGAQPVNTGTYYVSEAGGLAAYTKSLECTSNNAPISTGTGQSVVVAANATVVCTFTNTAVTPTITVVKTAGSPTVRETGGSVTYSVVVTNTSPIPMTLTSLNDDKFGNLDGKGTCNGAANAYGSIAVGGTYSCSFSETLAASEAGQTHTNEVTASATGDVGTATAKDTARVTYVNVNPGISVVKSADFISISANAGDSVDGFTQDVRFARGSVGGSGGALTFATNICDDGGANDINAAQSDLNCFSRADNVNGHIGLRWSWDAVAQWTGTGQTGDACALLDTDNNGSANFAFCVRIYNPTATTIDQVTPGSPVLYKCKDSQADRCASPNSIQSITNGSICSVEKVANRIAGGEDDGDIEATCDVNLQDLGNNVNIANIDLLNVCSFPSGSPGSSNFDCVILPAAGLLIIQERTTPANSDAYFAFTLRNGNNTGAAFTTDSAHRWEVQGGANSAGLPILPGSYALVQQNPTSSNWRLGSITCLRDGNNVGTSNLADLAKLSIPIVKGSTTTCTFNDSLVASQVITFTVVVTNDSLEAVTLDSLYDTEYPDDPTPTYATLRGVGTCNSSTNPFGNIPGSGGTYTCEFTRTVSGLPNTSHKDKVRAKAKDNEGNYDTKISNKVTVSIN